MILARTPLKEKALMASNDDDIIGWIKIFVAAVLSLFGGLVIAKYSGFLDKIKEKKNEEIDHIRKEVVLEQTDVLYDRIIKNIVDDVKNVKDKNDKLSEKVGSMSEDVAGMKKDIEHLIGSVRELNENFKTLISMRRGQNDSR